MPGVIYGVIALALFLYTVALLARFIWSILTSLNPALHPSGAVTVVVESVYTITDPAIKGLNRLIPPVQLGQVQLRLSELLLFFVSSFAWQWFMSASLRN